MTINLHTGLPRNGKTLYTLWYVKKYAEKENRQVYYNGIPELKIPGWIELENPEEWYKLPTGAIIVIDECQRLFRPRSNGTKVPQYVEELETHGHNGHDLFLITQHPMLLDQNIRRLTGCHKHVVRQMGFNKAVVHEWPSVKENCDKTRKDSQEHQWFYPKEVFDWYKSSDMHTVKPKIPKKLFLLAVLIVVGLGCAAYAYSYFDQQTEKAKPQQAKAKPGKKAPEAAPKPDQKDLKPVDPLVAYFDARKPRVAGLPHTAPIYDQVTQPTSAPFPAACMKLADKCRCYSQQSTIIDTSEELCKQIVERGYFIDWNANPQQQQPQQKPELPQVAQVNQSNSHDGGIIAGWGRYDHPTSN